jgi:hypothetical protein
MDQWKQRRRRYNTVKRVTEKLEMGVHNETEPQNNLG